MFDKYLIIGAAVALLAAGAFITYQTNKIDGLEKENAVLEATVADKNLLIDTQNTGIADLQKAAVDSAATIKAAGDSIDILTAKLAAERSKRNAKVEKDYALPDCTALLATDLAAVCPAHAQRVRDAIRQP